MRDIVALCKVYMINILSNKFAFVYNLLLPIIYFIYKNVTLTSSTSHFTAPAMETIGNFWAYIIFATILNNVIVSLIVQREQGFYKQMLFVVGSKLKVITAIFLVQLAIICIELSIFNILVMIVAHQLSFKLLFAGVAVALLSALPVTLIGSVLLIFKIKIESINILLGIILFGLLFIMSVPTSYSFTGLVILLNPLSFVTEMSLQVQNTVFNTGLVNAGIWLQMVIVSLCYAIIGYYSFSKFSVNAIADRV
ncbi:hypothetical protein QMA60_09770 [Leuconostoc suionicum]|uniref:ABC-2 family transporter protein n=2 Tax=Lactobacillaceae TaxID=33958 RepID=A0A2N9K879_9LACO|nr:hypothetical protein [Leuconostoc suionicum]API72017.1 hypothetical protein A6B45_04745 [Leuconostoc suionicum]MBE4728171.1 hypothetical protein [Leuconostoc suionicum]MCT4401763.1 hypothetical protein [Leuconostoc suionicum]MDI6500943.1 hypothetical protein [Leuconostoc suionicum]MDI6503037.1 hypothetical protein [Leuconostoc suionicum]